MNPFATQITVSSTENTSDASTGTRRFAVALEHADTVTSTFAVVMFGLAIPLNAYVMLAYADAFNFRNPTLVSAVRWSFPWLPLLLAIGIPVVTLYNRKKHSGRRRIAIALFLLAMTVLLGLTVFFVVSMPIVTWLNSL